MMIAQIAGVPVVRFPQSTEELVLSNCHIGIEVELEGVSSGRVPNGMSNWWTSVSDNSLRHDGREFIFREPTAGVEAVNAINSLYANWNEDWQIVERGSMHVHIDIRDMKADQYLLFRLYSLALDETLFGYSPERYSSPFCRAASRSQCSILALQHMLRNNAGSWDTGSVFLSENRKYLSINVNSGITFGSMEFRHFQVPSTRNDMLAIVNALLMIKKAAMETAPNDIERNLKAAVSRMDHSAIKEAFPEAAASIDRHLKLAEVL